MTMLFRFAAAILLTHPELYRQNGICHDEKLENLLILLETSSTANEASTATD